ncbi:MoxR protein [Sandaracinus amylolyticus]|uniref:MoxR protein n=1 Tax=Sandaracinus amylolyticus TaxID=927083 RepID=A0A0F6W3C4_9BACT|nr:MoxR family ATPase [Sandaracinus amylolyticus]AKF06227.1 MoxR protein [Sandaracinus amylolyticus]
MEIDVDGTSPAESAAAQRPEVTDVERVERLADARRRLVAEVKKRIVGQDDVIELMLISLFARGHGLFVGVPGLAKTLLISTLAEVLSLRSSRIQFTPDLMPTDITGTDVLEEDPASGERRFRFVPGPVFTNVLLADEINRTPPKTQAALLQAMAEGRVTAGGKTYPLELPYLVFATQNPIEQEGTYPLPEAQLDRFLFQIDVGYPSADEEMEIVRRTTAPIGEPPTAVLTQAEILDLQALVPRVPVAPHVIEHAVKLVRLSRPEESGAPDFVKSYVAFGAGPRASQALVIGAKARAVLDGRFAAEVEDVRALATPVLRHRIVPSFRAEAEGVRAADLVQRLLEATRA